MTSLESIVLSLQQEFASTIAEFKQLISLPMCDQNIQSAQTQQLEEKLTKNISFLSSKNDSIQQDLKQLTQQLLLQNNTIQNQIQSQNNSIKNNEISLSQFQIEFQDRISLQIELSHENHNAQLHNFITAQNDIITTQITDLSSQKAQSQKNLQDAQMQFLNEIQQLQIQFSEFQSQLEISKNQIRENLIFQSEMQQKFVTYNNKNVENVNSLNGKISVNEQNIKQFESLFKQQIVNQQNEIQRIQENVKKEVENQNTIVNKNQQNSQVLSQNFNLLNEKQEGQQGQIKNLQVKTEEMDSRIEVQKGVFDSQILLLEEQNKQIISKMDQILTWQNVNEPIIKRVKNDIQDVENVINCKVQNAVKDNFNDLDMLKHSLVGIQLEKIGESKQLKFNNFQAEISNKLEFFDKFLLQNEGKLKTIQLNNIKDFEEYRSQLDNTIELNSKNLKQQCKDMNEQNTELLNLQFTDLKNQLQEQHKIIINLEQQNQKLTNQIQHESQAKDFQGKQLLQEYQASVLQKQLKLDQDVEKIQHNYKFFSTKLDQNILQQNNDLAQTKVLLINKLNKDKIELKQDILQLLENDKQRLVHNQNMDQVSDLISTKQLENNSFILKQIQEIYDCEIKVLSEKLNIVSLNQQRSNNEIDEELEELNDFVTKFKDNFDHLAQQNDANKLLLEQTQNEVSQQLEQFQHFGESLQTKISHLDLSATKHSELHKSSKSGSSCGLTLERDIAHLQKQFSTLYDQVQKFLIPSNQNLQPYIDTIEQFNIMKDDILRQFQKTTKHQKHQIKTFSENIENSISETTDTLMLILNQIIKKNQQLVIEILPQMQNQIFVKMDENYRLSLTQNLDFYQKFIQDEQENTADLKQLQNLVKQTINEPFIGELLLTQVNSQIQDINNKLETYHLQPNKNDQDLSDFQTLILDNYNKFLLFENTLSQMQQQLQKLDNIQFKIETNIQQTIQQNLVDIINKQVKQMQSNTEKPLDINNRLDDKICDVIKQTDTMFVSIQRHSDELKQEIINQKQDYFLQQQEFQQVLDNIQENNSNQSLIQQITKFGQQIQSTNYQINTIESELNKFKQYIGCDFMLNIVQKPVQAIHQEISELKLYFKDNLLPTAIGQIFDDNNNKLNTLQSTSTTITSNLQNQITVLQQQTNSQFIDQQKDLVSLQGQNQLLQIDIDSKIDQKLIDITSNFQKIDHQLYTIRSQFETKNIEQEKLQFQMKQDSLSTFETYSDLISKFRTDLNQQFESVQNLFNQQILEQKQLFNSKFSSHLNEITNKSDANTQLINYFMKSINNQKETIEFLLQNFEQFNQENNAVIQKQMEIYMKQTQNLNQLSQGELTQFRNDIDTMFKSLSDSQLDFNSTFKLEVKQLNNDNLSHVQTILGSYSSKYNQVIEDFNNLKYKLNSQICDYLKENQQQKEGENQIISKFTTEIQYLANQINNIQQTSDQALTITSSFRSELSKNSNKLETAISEAIVSIDSEKSTILQQYKTLSEEQKTIKNGMQKLQLEVKNQLKQLFTDQEPPLTISTEVKRLTYLNFDQFAKIDQTLKKEIDHILQELLKRDCELKIKVIKISQFVFEINLKKFELQLTNNELLPKHSKLPLTEFLYDKIMD